MMISPFGFRKQHENDSLEELIEERNGLMEYIVNYEKKDKDQNNIEIDIKPSPATRYDMYNEYLKEIVDLILIQTRKKK